MSVSVTLRADDPPGHFWFDNGLVWLLLHKGEGTYPIEELRDFLLEHLVKPTGNMGEYYDPDTGSWKEYKKKNWIPPLGYFIKRNPDPRGNKIELEGKKVWIRPPEYQLDFEFPHQAGICMVCGQEAPLMDAKMWVYPFMVDPGKFGNFYSMARAGFKLCPRCAVCGLAAYLSWFWLLEFNTKMLHVFLFHTDIRALEHLHRDVLQHLRLEEATGNRNVQLPFWGAYLHENLLALILRLFALLHSQEEGVTDTATRAFLEALLGEPLSERRLPLTLYGASGALGQAFQARALYTFTRIHTLYRLYRRWLRELESPRFPAPHQQVVAFFRRFTRQEGRQQNSIWRQQVAYAVLELADPFPYIEDYLFQRDVRPLAAGSHVFINIYTTEVLHMQPEMLHVLRGFGHSLGKAAAEKKDMSLLYALRNAKNIDEFLRVLNDMQFRLNLTVPTRLIQVEDEMHIGGVPWKRVKTLLSIFAMNTYLQQAHKEASETTETHQEATS